MDLEAKFNEAMQAVMSLKKRPSNDMLLKLYALKKQATEGDVHGAKPGMFDIKGQAKYKAWTRVKGKSSEDAMQEYVNLVDSLLQA